MNNRLKIRVELVGFFVFAVFVILTGLSADSSITGFSVKDNGNQWIVGFEMDENGDLVMEMIEGDGYSSIDDVEFIEMRCGNNIVIPNILTNNIVYEDYHCEEKSSLMFLVNSEGRFKQRLSLGDDSRTIMFVR